VQVIKRAGADAVFNGLAKCPERDRIGVRHDSFGVDDDHQI
jgi:predicted restriction endonuclease